MSTTTKITLEQYNHNWPQQFEIEAAKLRTALKDNVINIFHIGSTSIPGMVAKPKIDIILELNHFYDIIQTLQKINYIYKGEYNIPLRLFFRKENINLHVYEKNHAEIKLNLMFRDLLRRSPELCAQYSALKQSLVKQEAIHHKTGTFVEYTLRKNDFIKTILEKASFTGICLRICAHYDEWTEYHRLRKNEIFDRIENVIYDPNHPTMSNQNHSHLVLYQGILIIGVAQIEFCTQEYCILRTIAIDSKMQKNGYGKYLLQLIEKWIQYKNIKNIYLNTDNSIAPFYKKLGYNEITFPDPHGLNLEYKIQLGKNL